MDDRSKKMRELISELRKDISSLKKRTTVHGSVGHLRKDSSGYKDRDNKTLFDYEKIKYDEDGMVLPEYRHICAKLNKEMKKQSTSDDRIKWQGISNKTGYDWRNG